MGSTLTCLHLHVIFSCKNRHPFLTGNLLQETHEYLGGTARGLGAKPVMVGGIEDHVHLLLGLKPTHAPSNLIREIKKSSSEWGKEFAPNFGWQDGYAAYSVGPKDVSKVTRYVANQEQHHRTKSFEEERLELLKWAGIPFDPKYLDKCLRPLQGRVFGLAIRGYAFVPHADPRLPSLTPSGSAISRNN